MPPSPPFFYFPGRFGDECAGTSTHLFPTVNPPRFYRQVLSGKTAQTTCLRVLLPTTQAMQLMPQPAFNPTCDTTGITIYPLVHQRFKGHPHIHMVAHQRSTAHHIIEKMATLRSLPQRHPFPDSLALVVCPITHLKEHPTTSSRVPIISNHMGKEPGGTACSTGAPSHTGWPWLHRSAYKPGSYSHSFPVQGP